MLSLFKRDLVNANIVRIWHLPWETLKGDTVFFSQLCHGCEKRVKPLAVPPVLLEVPQKERGIPLRINGRA